MFLKCLIVLMLKIVYTNDLIDPSDEWADLDINSRYILATTAEAPRHQTCQLVIALIFAYQGTTSVTLNKNVYLRLLFNID